LWRPAGSPLSRRWRTQEGLPIRATQSQRVGQKLHRLSLGRLDDPALDVADRSGADSGLLRESFLREIPGFAKTPESLAESVPLRAHGLPFIASAGAKPSRPAPSSSRTVATTKPPDRRN